MDVACVNDGKFVEIEFVFISEADLSYCVFGSKLLKYKFLHKIRCNDKVYSGFLNRFKTYPMCILCYFLFYFLFFCIF